MACVGRIGLMLGFTMILMTSSGMKSRKSVFLLVFGGFRSPTYVLFIVFVGQGVSYYYDSGTAVSI